MIDRYPITAFIQRPKQARHDDSVALDLAPAHRVNGIALGAILPPSIAASAENDGSQDAPQSSAALEESGP